MFRHLQEEPWWDADRRAPPAGGAAVPAARQVGYSVCRRSISFLLISWRNGTAQNKTKAPPLLFFSATHFALHIVALRQGLGRGNAERERLSSSSPVQTGK